MLLLEDDEEEVEEEFEEGEFQLHNVSMKLFLVFFAVKADTRIKKVKLVAHRVHPVVFQLKKVKLVQKIVNYVHQIQPIHSDV